MLGIDDKRNCGKICRWYT